MLRWLWTLVMVRSICDGLNVSAWLVLDTRCWRHSGSNCDGLFVNVWLVLDASYWQRRGSDWNRLDVNVWLVLDANCLRQSGHCATSKGGSLMALAGMVTLLVARAQSLFGL